MYKYTNDFLLMLQFLTRIPININLNCEKDNFRKGAVFLPIVGFIVGGLQWIIYYLLNKVLPNNIIAVIMVITAVMVTGALHIDGLGDTCDGFFAFKGKDRIIEIMKDSRIGSFGAIAVSADLLMKVMAISYILDSSFAAAVIAAAVMGRFSIIFISYISKPAKSNGSGNLFIGNMNRIIVLISGLLSFGINIVLLGLKISLIIFSAVVILTFLFKKYCENKIGGATGDILGANNELVEILTLIIVVSTIRHNLF
ncbi:adenosylcobinamide-GDP ribazoletransferase [Clostridium sp. SYSU_GA19001]|uniref:adenosylcobinamide-GDP ribazoletransferase n=1 Tax=Clostridium caldaquaticum TaxID=2940653 RepID=UPI002076D64E|nr:adenosylcobinamide-GDP ribazoletransferase [Clostridium caldaquaticum]MCM8710058.1 adenosylcobinamide-GDP ribazoletransferase [Clostridium caldaquaticum]